MNFEPQKFFIGLMDFFSILLPGALLTYLLMGEAGPAVLGADKYLKLTGAEGVAAFLVSSYLFGHLVFLLGSLLDELYDWIRGYTLNMQIKLLAHRGKLLPWIARAVIWWVFKQERDLAVERAKLIKQQALDPLQAKAAINTFQWCKTLLMLESRECLSVVQRFEADSKFFRCFVIVLMMLVIIWVFQHKWQLTGIGLALIPLALWRFMEQRFKATNQAYWSVITLTAKERKITLVKSTPESARTTHAGGVVYRLRGGEVEYLLVEAKNDTELWVLPKGHIEEGEHSRETAVREVYEETGVWAKICADLGCVSYPVEGTDITVQLFLMEYAGCGLRSEVNREHIWLPDEKAVIRASHPETCESIRSAKKRLEKK